MAAIGRFLRGARALIRKQESDLELDDELRDYLNRLVEQKVEAGKTHEQALREARLELGNLEVIKEEVRDQGWEFLAESLWRDFRFGARTLFLNQGFSVVIVLTLALGIGANSAIFSAVSAVLLRSFPIAQPDRVLFIRQVTPSNPGMLISIPNFMDYRRQQTSFRQLTLLRSGSVNLTGGDYPERVVGSFVSDNFFDVLGVKARLGRTFVTGEDQPGADAVALVGYRAWVSRFGSDPKLLGRRLTLNNESYTVVGVLPEEFSGGWLANSDVYLTAQHSPAYSLDRKDPAMFMVGRLKDGVSQQQALADLTLIEKRLASDYPDVMTGIHVELTSVPEMEKPESSSTPLLIILAAVMILLLIGCLNVATLLLARGSARQQELAVRAALGASRTRLIRQLLIESLLLSFVGGLFGLLLAVWLVWSFADYSTIYDIPHRAALDWKALLFTLSVSVLTGVLAGIVPAIRLSKMNPATNFTGGSRIAGHQGHRLRSGFVIAQLALAIVLLVSASMLVKSFRALLAVNVGFTGEKVLSMEYRLPRNKYKSAAEQWNFHRTMVARVGEVPGVVSAGIVQALPLSGNWGEMMFTLPGKDVANNTGGQSAALVNLITPDYFSTIGSPILRGRTFSEQDGPDGARVIIVTRSFASKYWPNQNPIGQEIEFTDRGPGIDPTHAPTHRAVVVGVAADVKQVNLRDTDRPLVYFPYSQMPAIFGTLIVRAAGDPSALTDSIRRAVWSVDKDQPVWRIRTISAVFDQQVAPDKLMMTLVCAFGALAMMLGVIGAYGLLSNAVNERRKEIGVRMALGATPTTVLRWLITQAIRMTVVGIGLGLIGALIATRFMTSFLYGVPPADAFSLMLGAALMSITALLASYIPARRASRFDPMVTLRCE